MASQALSNSDESVPGNHAAVDGSNHGRYPNPQVSRADTEYREVNVDQLSESDFEGMRDSGLAYSDHDYIGSNPNSKCPPETSQFPLMGGVTDQYLNGETTDPCVVDPSLNRPTGSTSSTTAPASAMRKMQLGVTGMTNFRPAKDLVFSGAQQLPTSAKSVSWKQNVTQPKKSGRPAKNEIRGEMSGDRLMGRAMVKAGMQTQHAPLPPHLHQPQGVHGMQDLGHNIHGAAPIVTPARGQKIMPRGRSAAVTRRDIPDEGSSGYGMIPLQHATTAYRSISVPTPKKIGQRSAQAAEDAHTREMMEAAQNALAPTNTTISGHNIMMNAQNEHHPIVLPVHHQVQPSHHMDDRDLPRTPGKTRHYSPIASPTSGGPRRTISESQEMNMHLMQEPIRMNPDGLPVTPGGNRKTPGRSKTPRSRMSISESTSSQGPSPLRQVMISPSRQGMVQSRPYSSPQRMMTALKSPPTAPILSLTQGPSTMASAQMQMSSNAPMPSLHNQTYQQSPVTPRNTGTSHAMMYYDAPGAQAAPLITASGSNTYTPRRRKEKETDEAVEAEVSRNVKNIMQSEKSHRLSTTSSHTLSPRNDSSDEDSMPRGRFVEPSREKKKSTNKRSSQKQTKQVMRQSSKDESEDDEEKKDDWIVACICGQTEDDGETMVACDKCIRWEHVDCIFPRTKTAPTGGYTCHTCDPRPTELKPYQARDYQDRVKREKQMQSDSELKRKLQERAAKKEESSRKPPFVNRMAQSKGSTKNDKSAGSNYREIDRNEYSANAKRLLAISRSSSTPSPTPDILKTLRDYPRAKPLVVESNISYLFTTKTINGGDYVAELCGMVSTLKECPNRDGSCNDQTFLIEKDGYNLIIDARKIGNYARYVRRSCKPNTELQVVMAGSDLHIMIKAIKRMDNVEEVTIGLESDWRMKPRSSQECSCKDIDLKTCEVQLFFNRNGKNAATTSRRSVAVNGMTPKGGGSPIRRAVTEKKKSASAKKVITKKGRKKGTIKLPRPIRKSKGSTSTMEESEGEEGTEGTEEYEESTIDEKEEKNVRRGGRRNTGSTSEGKEKEIKREEEHEMPLLTPTRSSTRIRNDSEMKKEIESPKKEEIDEKMKQVDKRENIAGGSKKGGRKSGIEEEKEIKKEIKEEIKEEPSTPRMKKEKRPWPVMNYDLPSERNKPTREERKIIAMNARFEQDEKRNRASSSRGRSSSNAETPIVEKNEKTEKVLTSGRGKRKADNDNESGRADHITAAASTPLMPPVRKRIMAADIIGKKEKETSSPAPSSSLSSSMPSPRDRDRDDQPAASPAPAGGKKKWLQRHQEEQKAAAEAASKSSSSVSMTTSRTSTPTRSKRFNKKEERGAVEVLMNMGGVEKKGETLREEMRRTAIMLRGSLIQTIFSIGDMTVDDYIPLASTSSAPSPSPLPPTAPPVSNRSRSGPSTPPLPSTPITPIESTKEKKNTLSYEEYRKRRQTGVTMIGVEKKEEKERKEVPPKKSFMPSADASASISTLPNLNLPGLEEQPSIDELSKRIHGDLPLPSTRRSKDVASTSTPTSTPVMGKTQPPRQRQSINDRLKNEFSLPILSTPSPLTVSTSISSIPSTTSSIRPPSISPIPSGGQLTPSAGIRPHKNRLSDDRAMNVDPPGMISTPRLSSGLPSTIPSPSISSHPNPSPSLSSTSLYQRAASIRSSDK